MCGIIAIFGKEESLDNFNSLVELTKNSTPRGRDSAGLAFFKERSLEYYKKPGVADSVLEKVQPVPIKLGIGHTRAKTIGDPSNNDNNHPIKHDCFTVVHNGSISNHLEIERSFGIDLPGMVDSRVIAGLLDFFFRQDGSMIEAIKSTAKELDGSFAVAFLHSAYPNKLWLFKHFNPVYLAVDSDDNLFVASEENFIKNLKKSDHTVELSGLSFEGGADFKFHMLDADTGLEVTRSEDGSLQIEKFDIEVKKNSLAPSGSNSYPLSTQRYNGSTPATTTRAKKKGHAPDEIVIYLKSVLSPESMIKVRYILKIGKGGRIDYKGFMEDIKINLRNPSHLNAELYQAYQETPYQVHARIIKKLMEKVRKHSLRRARGSIEILSNQDLLDIEDAMRSWHPNDYRS